MCSLPSFRAIPADLRRIHHDSAACRLIGRVSGRRCRGSHGVGPPGLSTPLRRHDRRGVRRLGESDSQGPGDHGIRRGVAVPGHSVALGGGGRGNDRCRAPGGIGKAPGPFPAGTEDDERTLRQAGGRASPEQGRRGPPYDGDRGYLFLNIRLSWPTALENCARP